ncbi:MAG: helix-turn-helix domain-containing protein, partial [Christensenellaceae bacterium]|nr:helix-turn-helix domain-containing protein [Christensenellaceae bacterium]
TAKTFIRIPSKVSTDEKLSAGAKLLFGEVYKLNTYNTTCCATNQYFATKFSVSITTIKRRVSELVKGVWINRVITYKSNGNKVFASRFLGVTTKAFEEEEQTAERDNKVVNAVTLI